MPGARRRIDIVCFAIIFAFGIFIRLPPSLFQKPDGPLHSLVVLHLQPASQQLGFDEGLYRDYTDKLIRFGLISYPEIIERYREKQQTLIGFNSATGPLPLHFLCLSMARAFWIGNTKLSQERIGCIQHLHSAVGCDFCCATRWI